jgi:hypothetical protein
MSGDDKLDNTIDDLIEQHVLFVRGRGPKPDLPAWAGAGVSCGDTDSGGDSSRGECARRCRLLNVTAGERV